MRVWRQPRRMLAAVAGVVVLSVVIGLVSVALQRAARPSVVVKVVAENRTGQELVLLVTHDGAEAAATRHQVAGGGTLEVLLYEGDSSSEFGSRRFVLVTWEVRGAGAWARVLTGEEVEAMGRRVVFPAEGGGVR